MKARKIILAAIGCLAAIGLVGGTLAYMSSNETGTNVFLTGDVHIKSSEPKFPTKDENGDGVPDDNEKMVPFQEEPKDPRIKNTGKNDAIVFMKVTVPAEYITEIKDDGSRSEKQENDIFWMKLDSDGKDSHSNSFDPEWTELTDVDGNLVDEKDCNEEGRGRVYIFGYRTRLSENKSTSALFDKVQNKRYGSQTISPTEKEQIIIDSYAVQADDIYKDGKVVDTNGTIPQDTLTYIYQVYCNQNS